MVVLPINYANLNKKILQYVYGITVIKITFEDNEHYSL